MPIGTLVTSGDLFDFLGLTTEQQSLADDLAGLVEALLLQQCGRGPERPFQAAQPGRVEIHDGTGNPLLWLDYRVDTLTSVLLGQNPSTPDETLNVSDPAVLVWGVGSPRIARVDGRRFGCLDRPRYIQVTYDAQADAPAEASLAVLRVTAAVRRQRGSEDAKSERMGAYSADLAAVAQDDPVWQMAVAGLGRWR